MTHTPALVSPRTATQRHDGWTPERQRIFLETLAECGTVQDACRAAGMSPASAYALRQRKSGALFALGWAAALRHARERLADELLSRAMHGCTETVERGDEIITRHRFDNRLSMAMLTRLDREAEKFDDAARTVAAVAEDFEAMLECVGAGDAEGQVAFVAAHRPTSSALPKVPFVDAELMMSLVEADRLRAYASVRPEDIDTSDLDPDEFEDWDDDQWERAYRSGFIDALGQFDAEDDDEDDEDADEDAESADPDETPWHVSTSSTSA